MGRKILRTRTLSNLVLGRLEFTEEKMDFERTKELLKALSDQKCVKGKIGYANPSNDERPGVYFNKSTNPTDSYQWVSAVFKQRRIYPIGVKHYFEGHHEVYSGHKSEMHYIKISDGSIRREDPVRGRGEAIKKLHQLATLEFLIKNF